MPPAASFRRLPRLFEPASDMVRSEFRPVSRFAEFKATLGNNGLFSFPTTLHDMVHGGGQFILA